MLLPSIGWTVGKKYSERANSHREKKVRNSRGKRMIFRFKTRVG